MIRKGTKLVVLLVTMVTGLVALTSVWHDQHLDLCDHQRWLYMLVRRGHLTLSYAAHDGPPVFPAGPGSCTERLTAGSFRAAWMYSLGRNAAWNVANRYNFAQAKFNQSAAPALRELTASELDDAVGPGPFLIASSGKVTRDTIMRMPFWLLPAVLGVLCALNCARRPLRRYRRRVHGQCPSCGYDLTGNVSGVCPECGAPAKV
ncbi:MAG TPA: hypothetical protein VGM03_09510 [Phycisphaerae bacterium]